MSNSSRFANSFPALHNQTVTEGHARYCRENGHAFNRQDGVERGWCPRCGEDNGPGTHNPAEDIARCTGASRVTIINEVRDANGNWVERDRTVWPSTTVALTPDTVTEDEPVVSDPEFVDQVQVTIVDDDGNSTPWLTTEDAIEILQAALPEGAIGSNVEHGDFDADFLVSLRRDVWDRVLAEGDMEWGATVRSVTYAVVIVAEAR